MAPKRAADTSCDAAAEAAPASPSGTASSSGAASSSSGSLAQLARSGSSKAQQVTSDIETLIELQKEQRAHRRKLAADLKNAKKRKARLQKRARLLSTEELLTVVALREGSSFDASELFPDSQPPREDSPARGSDEDHDVVGREEAREEENPGSEPIASS